MILLVVSWCNALLCSYFPEKLWLESLQTFVIFVSFLWKDFVVSMLHRYSKVLLKIKILLAFTAVSKNS